jgi:CO/xanthine dehydrogenase FAD-binding subunit
VDLNTVQEVVLARDRSAQQGWRDGDAWLAGGTALFSEPRPELRRLLDVMAFGWPPLTPGGDTLEIAATCTLAELAGYGKRAGITLIEQCCGALWGSFKVQNVATVGGNLCGALPAGPMTSLVTGLGGWCEIWTPDGGARRVDALDFVTGPSQNCLRPGELLRSITLPAVTSRTAFAQISLTQLGRSAALVIARRDADHRVVFTVTAATPRPVQLSFADLPSATELADAARTIGEYFDDVHGDPAWRRAMTARLLEQVRAELDQP